MAYNALPPRPRGESRYIATVILNGLIKCILNNTKLGGKKAEAVLNVFIQYVGGKMWLLLWGWVEEVLLPPASPKDVVPQWDLEGGGHSSYLEGT